MTQINDSKQTNVGELNGSTGSDISPDAAASSAANVQDGTLYCANHPSTETLLRCNRCEKPICLKCAKLTDVGYRCNDCLRNVQDNYFNAESNDNLIAFAVAFGVTFFSAPIAGLIISLFGLLFGVLIALLVGSGAGGALAQIIRSAVGKRRGRNLRYFALAGIIFGCLLGIGAGAILIGFVPNLITLLVFVFVASSAAVGVLR